MTTRIPSSMLLDSIVFGAKTHGALGNGAAIDGPAIQAAMNAASTAGATAVPIDTAVTMLRIAGSYPI